MDENEIAAVRRIRHEISEECNHDVERVIAYYRSVQEELKQSGSVPICEIRDLGMALAGRAGEG